MRKNNKKGFTIVELVIVIAVIAILAAVLIPTFVGLVKKANNSADVQMITNINKYLEASEILDGKNETMHDAVQDAADAGYNLAALVLAKNSENTILWSQEHDRFIAVDEDGDIVAGKDDINKNIEDKDAKIKKVADGDKYKYWIVSNEVTGGYSVYYTGKSKTDTIEINNIGFDAGDAFVNVTYRGDKDVIIRTNVGYVDGTKSLSAEGDVIFDLLAEGETTALTGNLTINTTANVKHYGIVNELKIENAKSYTEYGYVFKVAQAYTGKFNANGARFHQKGEYSDSEEVVILRDEEGNGLLYITGDAKYNVHENPNTGATKCLFCDTYLCQHVMGEADVVLVTCLGAGSSFSQCSKGCGYIEYIVTPALGHDVDNLNEIPATCTKPGQTATQVCKRCGVKLQGDIIFPLGHDFTGVTEKSDECKHGCGVTLADYLGEAVHIDQDSFKSGKVDFKGKDVRKDMITVFLDGDIEVTADEFTSLLGTEECVYWIYKDGEIGGTTEEIKTKCHGHGIFALDLVLNGYTLTINSKDAEGNSSEWGIGTYGHLKISGRDNTEVTDDKNALILKDKTSAWGPVIGAVVRRTQVTFDSINVTADTYPVYLSYWKPEEEYPNILSVNKSNLTLPESISTDNMGGQNLCIYVEVESATKNGKTLEDLAKLDDDNISIMNWGKYWSAKDGTIWLAKEKDSIDQTMFTIVNTNQPDPNNYKNKFEQYNVKFFVIMNGNKIYLKFANYYDKKDDKYFSLIHSDDGGNKFNKDEIGYYAECLSCRKDQLFDENNNPITIQEKITYEKNVLNGNNWVKVFNDAEYESKPINSLECVNVSTDSTCIVK